MLTNIIITILICQSPDGNYTPNKCKIGVTECTVKDAKNIDEEIKKCLEE